tara:strand:+ start:3810 stop:4868 length:1059 start_codon:yes stop_codon:yes gene_type:complete
MLSFKRGIDQKKNFSKRSILNQSILIGTVFLSGLSQSVYAKPKSVVAIEPLTCNLVKAIALPSHQVTCLISRDKDVHDFKIRPRQAKILSNSDYVFTLGKEMTPAIKNWMNNPFTFAIGATAIDIEDHNDDHSNIDVELIAQVPDEGEGHHHHDHGGDDPHVWHDPHNLIMMAEIIKEKFKKDISVFNSEERKLLNEKYKSASNLLENLDQWIVNQVATIPNSNKTIVSKHKAMEYYGNAFGFKTISLLDFLGHSSSLRPGTLNSVVKELRNSNVKVLFVEQKPPSKLIKNLSKQTSIPISSNRLYVDGLMLKGNIISVAVHNTCTIVNSLGGSCDKNSGSIIESKWDDLVN